MDAGSPIPMSSAPDILVLFTLYHFSGCADICFVFGWLRLLRGGAGSRPVRLSCLATAIASAFVASSSIVPAAAEQQQQGWQMMKLSNPARAARPPRAATRPQSEPNAGRRPAGCW